MKLFRVHFRLTDINNNVWISEKQTDEPVSLEKVVDIEQHFRRVLGSQDGCISFALDSDPLRTVAFGSRNVVSLEIVKAEVEC